MNDDEDEAHMAAWRVLSGFTTDVQALVDLLKSDIPLDPDMRKRIALALDPNEKSPVYFRRVDRDFTSAARKTLKKWLRGLKIMDALRIARKADPRGKMNEHIIPLVQAELGVSRTVIYDAINQSPEKGEESWHKKYGISPEERKMGTFDEIVDLEEGKISSERFKEIIAGRKKL